MRVVVEGWDRNHGEKEIMNLDNRLDDMPVAPENIRRTWGETYLQVHTTRFSGRVYSSTVHVWASANLNLNGSYQTHLELDHSDIGRLFYLTHGHKELDEIGRLLAIYKDEEEQRAAAITVSKEDARKAIVAQWQRLPAAERANGQQKYEFVKEAMKRYNWRVSAGAYQEAMAWLETHVGQP
jgi:hypothetical protein